MEFENIYGLLWEFTFILHKRNGNQNLMKERNKHADFYTFLFLPFHLYPVRFQVSFIVRTTSAPV